MVDRIRYWIRLKRFRFAYFVYAMRMPVSGLGPTSIGTTRAERDANIGLMHDRYFARGPKPEDYGLPADTAPSKYQEQQRAKQ